MPRPTAIAALLAAAAAPALAQSGTMYLSHDDPDGEVAPGQTVRFEMRLDWSGIHQLIAVQGNIRGTPDIGAITESYPPTMPGMMWSWGALIRQGTHAGANIESFMVSFTPALFSSGFIVPNPSRQPLTGTFLSWDWVAPAVKEPTVVQFAFEPGTQPLDGVWGTPSYTNPIPLVPVATTIVSAPILIDPANLHCPADLTTTAIPGQPGYGVPNNALENDDFFYYLTLFAAGDPGADLTHTAVFGAPGFGVGNSIVNNDDFFYYLSLFAAGC